MLIKKTLGLSLDELGITLVNIRSTGFENIALLFHDDRIRKKCSIITDLDAHFYDITAIAGGISADEKRKDKARRSEVSGALRKTALDTLCQGNDWLQPYYADHTFEVDFIKVGNQNTLKSVIGNVYTDANTISDSNTELSSSNIAISGLRALKMANYKKKGWFAITLSEKIEFNVSIPKYILNAVIFSHGAFTPNTLEKIINYRFMAIKEYVLKGREYVATLDSTTQASHISQWQSHLSFVDAGISTFTPKWLSYLSSCADIQTIKVAFMNDIPCLANEMLEGI